MYEDDSGLGAGSITIVEQLAVNRETVHAFEAHRFRRDQRIAGKIRRQSAAVQLAAGLAVAPGEPDAVGRLGTRVNKGDMSIVGQYWLHFQAFAESDRGGQGSIGGDAEDMTAVVVILGRPGIGAIDHETPISALH